MSNFVGRLLSFFLRFFFSRISYGDINIDLLQIR